jgi:trimeric autotransporter adhesin
MARITDPAYPVLTSPASGDVLPIVDISDTSQSPAGTTKQTTVADLLAGAGAGPMTTVGDTLYEGTGPAVARLPGNTTATKNFLTQTGTGSASAAPAWGTLASGDIPANAANTSGNAATATAASGLKSATTTVAVSAATAPASGQVLTASSSTAASWVTPSGSGSLPLTTLGDTLYENGTPAPAALAGNTTTTKKFLTQTGTGSVSAAPAWGALASGDIPANAANTSGTAANVTGTVAVANGGSGVTSLTAYAPVVGGTTSTGAVQSAATGMGTSGNVLTSNGSGALPTWQAPSGGGGGGGTSAVSSVTTSGTTTYTLAAATFGAFSITLGAASVPTFAFTGATAGSDVSFTVVLTQPSGGGITVTWPTVTWLGGVTPTLNTAGSAVSVFVFESIDGTSWLGSMITGPVGNGAATSAVSISAGAGESVIATTSIPANLPAGATYRITTSGTITVGGTAGTTVMRTRLGGLSGTQVQTLTTASLTASTTYNWRSVAEVTLQVPGSSGTWAGDLQDAVNVQGAAAVTYLANPATATASSTAAEVFVTTLTLSSTTSTASCVGSVWERVA